MATVATVALRYEHAQKLRLRLRRRPALFCTSLDFRSVNSSYYLLLRVKIGEFNGEINSGYYGSGYAGYGQMRMMQRGYGSQPMMYQNWGAANSSPSGQIMTPPTAAQTPAK